MVSRMDRMGEEGTNLLVTKIDNILMSFYKKLPFTYLGILRKSFGKYLHTSDQITLLDLGCGDGTMLERLELPGNFVITGVDIFEPYLKIAKRKGIYKRLIKRDARLFNSRNKFDIVLASHVLEHLTKTQGIKFIKKLENLACKSVIIATPIGDLPQDEYDSNPNQIHQSEWSVLEFKDMGYKINSQGLKLLWGNQNIVKEYGIFSYVFFLISTLSQPLLRIFPNLGTYMICYKEIARKR